MDWKRKRDAQEVLGVPIRFRDVRIPGDYYPAVLMVFAQHDPWPGQQQFPVTQQLAAFLSRWLTGEPNSDLAQQLEASTFAAAFAQQDP